MMEREVKYKSPDKPLRCSSARFEEFQSNSIWLDIQDLIDDRIEIIRNELEASETLEETRELQGRISELRDMKLYPDYLSKWAHIENENQMEEENDT